MVSDKILQKLAVWQRIQADYTAPKPAVAAPMPVDALNRIRDLIENAQRQKGTRVNLLNPTTNKAADLLTDRSRPCPNKCGPMVTVAMHGDRQGCYCTKCRIAVPLEELHV